MCEEGLPMKIDESLFKQPKKPVVNRALLTQKQYINLLATPRPNPPVPKEIRKKPKIIKPPEMCSPRLDQLAMPTRKLMESVLETYHDKFDPERVITLAKRIHIVSTQRQARTVPKRRAIKKKSKKKKPTPKERRELERRLAQEWLIDQINTSSFLIMLYMKYKPKYAPNYKQLLIALKIMKLLRIKKGKNYPKYTKRYILKICEQIAVLIDSICPASLQKLTDISAKEKEEEKKHICWKVHSGLSIFGIEVQEEEEEEEEAETVEGLLGEEEEAEFEEEELERLEALLEELEGEGMTTEDEDIEILGQLTDELLEGEEDFGELLPDVNVLEVIKEADEKEGEDEAGRGEGEDEAGRGEGKEEGKEEGREEGLGEEEEQELEGKVDIGEDKVDIGEGKAGIGEDLVEEEQVGIAEALKDIKDEYHILNMGMREDEEGGASFLDLAILEGVLEGEEIGEEMLGEEEGKLEEIIAHPPGTVCYLTWRIYCNWLTEFGDNIQKYGKCLTNFRQAFQFSEKKQIDLMKNILLNWSKYFTDCRQFEEKLTKYFRGKAITQCPICLEDYDIDNLPIDHEIPMELIDAMKSTTMWKEMLNEAEIACKEIESKIPPPSPDEVSLVSVGTIEITEVSRSLQSSESYIVMEEIDDGEDDTNKPGPSKKCS